MIPYLDFISKCTTVISRIVDVVKIGEVLSQTCRWSHEQLTFHVKNSTVSRISLVLVPSYQPAMAASTRKSNGILGGRTYLS